MYYEEHIINVIVESLKDLELIVENEELENEEIHYPEDFLETYNRALHTNELDKILDEKILNCEYVR